MTAHQSPFSKSSSTLQSPLTLSGKLYRKYLFVDKLACSLYEAGKQSQELLKEAQLKLKALDSGIDQMSQSQCEGVYLGFHYSSCIGEIERNCALLRIPGWHRKIFSLNHQFAVMLNFNSEGQALKEESIPPKSYVRLSESIEKMIRLTQNPDDNFIATSLAAAHQTVEDLRFLPRSEGKALRDAIKLGYWLGRHLSGADRILSVQSLESYALDISKLQKRVEELLILHACESAQTSHPRQTKQTKKYKPALVSVNTEFDSCIKKLEFFDKFKPQQKN